MFLFAYIEFALSEPLNIINNDSLNNTDMTAYEVSIYFSSPIEGSDDLLICPA